MAKKKWIGHVSMVLRPKGVEDDDLAIYAVLNVRFDPLTKKQMQDSLKVIVEQGKASIEMAAENDPHVREAMDNLEVTYFTEVEEATD